MKVNIMACTVAAMLLSGTAVLDAEPGNFGVNGVNAWSSIEQKRVEHKDAFGDTYYTYSAEKPKAFLEYEIHQHKQQVAASPKEVVDAFHKMLSAISLLHENNIKGAMEILKKANAQLRETLKKQPKLNQVLVSQHITIAQYFGDSVQIKKSIMLAERLLKDKSTQSAREILLRLQDALIVDNASVLVSSFSTHVNKALVLLEQGVLLQKNERDSALLMLNMVLNDVIYERVIVPVPFLKAQHSVITASTLDISKYDAINAYLDEATEELNRAILLGYIKKTSSAYKVLQSEIQKIQKALKHQHKSNTLYDRITETFKDLLNETRHKIIQSNAEAKVNTYERKEDRETLEKKKIFKNEAIKDEHKTLDAMP